MALSAGQLRRLGSLAATTRGVLRDRATTDALWASALIDLVTSRRDVSLDRVIRRLTEVARRDTLNSQAYLDAGAAYLVRAGREQRAADLLEGLRLAAKAMRLDTASSAARFNLSLFLDRLHLVGGAARELQQAQTLERSHRWRAEFAARTAELRSLEQSVDSRVRLDSAHAGRTLDSALFAEVVRQDAGTLRGFVVERLLPDWSERALAADSSGSGRMMAFASLAGRMIAAATGDSIVTWISRGLVRENRVDSTSVVAATALRRYAEGESAFRADRYEAAGKGFHEARTLLRKAASRARGTRRLALNIAIDWMTNRLGFIEILANRLTRADSIHLALLHRVAPSPGALALVGEARWGLAIAAIRRGETGKAAQEYESAAAAFAKAGDRIVGASVTTQLAQCLELSGLYPEALRLALTAQRDLRPHRARRTLVIALITLGASLEAMASVVPATYVYREAVMVAARAGIQSTRADAGARLASALARDADFEEARRSIAEARTVARNVPDLNWRPRFEADVGETEGYLKYHERPREAVAVLSSPIEYYRREGITGRLPYPLRVRAQARLAVADTTGALEDLAAALRVVEGQVVDGPGVFGLAALRETHAALYRQLVDVSLGRRDTAGAWEYSERARLPIRRVATGLASADPVEPTVSFTVLPDRLLLWTRTAGRIRVRETSIREADLVDRVSRFENLLRGAPDSASIAAMGADLYGILLRPVMGDLPDSGRLILVPEGPLQRVPFAALLDRRTGRFLIERFAISIASASGVTLPPDPVGGDVLVADASGFSREAFPDLAPLPAAAKELADVRRHEPRARVVADDAATRERLLHELPLHRVFHFIGHARSIDASPDRSHLVTIGGDVGSSIITGREIAALDLKNVGLVILSACGTVAGTDTRTGGIGGLPRAFLLAGAGQVVSSIWVAEDRAAAALMERFHAALPGTDPADALRRAQVGLARGDDRSLRTPAAWAAFRAEH